MKRARGVQRLRELCDACDDIERRMRDIAEPFAVELWVFGDLLDGRHEVDQVKVAVALAESAERVPWWSEPFGAEWWADRTRINKGAFEYWFRSVHAPVWNHYVGPADPGLVGRPRSRPRRDRRHRVGPV